MVYGLVFCIMVRVLARPTDHNAKKKKHVQGLSCICTAKKFELSSSLSMDVTQTELEIQESRH